MEFDRVPPLARLRPRDQLHYVSRNRTVLATARDGFIHGDGEQGLFVFQTRLLSLYRYFINGEPPEPAGISNLEEHSQIAYYIAESPNPDTKRLQGALGPGGRRATEAIELRLSRFAGDGFREEVELTNHTVKAVHVVLELEMDSDFADATHVNAGDRWQPRIERRWRVGQDGAELCWTCTAEHDYDHQGDRGHAALRCAASVRILGVPPPSYDEAGKRIRFEIDLPPRAVWKSSVLLSAEIHGESLEPAGGDAGESGESLLAGAAGFEIGTPRLAFVVETAVEQARRDLVSLRLHDIGNGGWTVAAGLPVYIAFFGRDALTASWQAALLGDGMMRGTLAHLAATQATETDDWRDAQPGRFVHQMETGPLAELLYNPNARYYGSLTGPGFYPVVLSNLWHWTGSRDVVRPFLEPALKGLAWLDREARTDRGFYAYRTRSKHGVKNQSWKDSYDAIVYPDGSQVDDPISPTEFQAFVFASKVRMSELLWWFDDRDTSRKLFDEAMELRDRFNETFWMEEEGCFGMGLDPRDRLIRSVGSESGHAVAAGIVSQDRVARVVDRIFRPDLFSGWGVRTLSAGHPAFNPFSYHRGSVWPAEQAAFCMGLMRYGLDGRLHQLARAQFEAAAIFEYCRLPELFSGHQRDEGHPIPALYPRADSPQAWSASAVPCMLQAMLGIFPYAPLGALFVDPHLPEWLPELRLKKLHVGEAVVDLRFRRRENGSTGYEVLDLRGKLRVVRQPSPWSLTTSFAERAMDVLSSFLPVHS